MNDEITGEEVRKWRKENGWTLSELGAALGGLDTAQVSRIETGGRGIAPAEQRLLRILMLRELPTGFPTLSQMGNDEIPFTAPEWELISNMARVSGRAPEEWVADRIREYLTYQGLRAGESVPAAIASENVLAFPEIPLLHAAAGSPIAADGDHFAPTRDYGPGRFACRLHGDSMAPKYPDGSTVILREKASLKRPVLKKGEVYLFVIVGEKTLKVYDTRKAKQSEITDGLSYDSPTGGKKVRILRALNPAFPEIVLDPKSDPDWIGWLDGSDQG